MTTKEYMPEVGKRCEIDLHSDDWSEDSWFIGVVTAIGDHNFLYKAECNGLEQMVYKQDVKFRPLKTPAETEREEAIEAMKAISIITIGDGMARLYDAGYRKVGDEVTDVGVIAEHVNHYYEDGELCIHTSDFLKAFKIYSSGE